MGLGASASPTPGDLKPGELADPKQKRITIFKLPWASIGVKDPLKANIGEQASAAQHSTHACPRALAPSPPSPVPDCASPLAPPPPRPKLTPTRGRFADIALHRAHYPAGTSTEGAIDEARARALLDSLVWSSWVEPADSPAEVNFHRPGFFRELSLRAPGDTAIDCSCCAARFVGPKTLALVASPVPTLAQCPPGSVIVRARYASVCGSDMPYFKSKRAASLYWDRDGFCGHEVVGHVVSSSSGAFKEGDAVLALPSSYFKAHAGSRQEWFVPEVHGVLLQPFPVRGGFSAIYTSHELYCYKLKECTKHLIAAQGLGTVLRMSRRLGSVLGLHVVVLGQGQNGLLATQLMSKMCAKSVVAVDPLEYRRKASAAAGATHTCTPEEAAGVVAELTGGVGADVVLEMVGHNQDTVNEAIALARCAGTVVAFGVPDDSLYERFAFTEFFRKNLKLVASVIPDPGVDFPDAVKLIEQGRFDVEALITHTLPLASVNEAFEMACNYEDNVLKLVVEFP